MESSFGVPNLLQVLYEKVRQNVIWGYRSGPSQYGEGPLRFLFCVEDNKITELVCAISSFSYVRFFLVFGTKTKIFLYIATEKKNSNHLFNCYLAAYG